jgi:hypothetical protein
VGAVVEAKVVTLQAPEVEREEEAFTFPSLATTYTTAQVVPLHALRERTVSCFLEVVEGELFVMAKMELPTPEVVVAGPI